MPSYNPPAYDEKAFAALDQAPYRDDPSVPSPPLLRSVSDTLMRDERRQRRSLLISRILHLGFATLIAGCVFIAVTGTFNSPSSSSAIVKSIFGPFFGFIGRENELDDTPTTHHPIRVSTSHACPANPDSSCHLSPFPETIDTCCVNAPGGQLLLAQFWDFAPAVGPADKWTLHGLWPDNCDGSFDQFCDRTRVVNSVETIFTASGAFELLGSMRDAWKAYQGEDDRLWTHEWNKHGTCISTLRPECYGADEDNSTQPMLEYFSRALDLHSTLDTFSALEDAGITPSWDARFNLSDITEAIQASITDGHNVTLGCTRSGVLSEVWYHFNVKGRAQDGDYVFSEPDGLKSSCPLTGVKYFPKVPRSQRPPRPVPAPAPGNEPFVGKGYVIVNDGTHGCLISGGQWYSSGTCATFRGVVSEFGGVVLHSSRGPCAIDEAGKFTCAHSIEEPTQFTVGPGGELQFGGSSIFSAYQSASGWLKEGVWSASKVPGLPVDLSLNWRALA
ncbi:ribonuclease T2-like protein [Lipomyces oligophaga]|uniref:ribonuclease T2-like protein n=1 Tax=Lipomyces oligophaga TaxID=45792 RepID=UPI0034CED56C